MANIELLEPLEYRLFVDLMRRAHILLTDSGGIQEEGPSLGKPVLVLRQTTERPEVVEAGTVRLVGTDAARIVAETTRLLDDEEERRRMSQIQPLWRRSGFGMDRANFGGVPRQLLSAAGQDVRLPLSVDEAQWRAGTVAMCTSGAAYDRSSRRSFGTRRKKRSSMTLWAAARLPADGDAA